MRAYNPIILALDYDNMSEAEAMLSKVRPHIGMIKVGLELYTSAGKDVFSLIKDYAIPMFLDLKLHDIPTTVQKTMDMLTSILATQPGQHFISLHSLGGGEMLKAALEVTMNTNVKPVCITVLSSFSSSDLWSLGFSNGQIGNKVIGLAKMAMGCIDQGQPGHPGHPGWAANHWSPGSPPIPPTPARDPIGMDAFVCPPAQLHLMRKHFKDKPILIAPGIRMDNMESDDHQNAKPVSFALKNGANWLVIGRPITKHPDPATMAEFFKKQADKY